MLRLPKHPVTAYTFLGQQSHKSWAIGRELKRLVSSAYGHNESELIIIVRTSDLEIGVSQVKRRTGGRLDSRKQIENNSKTKVVTACTSAIKLWLAVTQ